MVTALILCLLIFGMNDVWSFHAPSEVPKDRKNDSGQPPKTAQLFSNFPIEERKDNIITELHTSVESNPKSLKRLLLEHPVPGGAIEIDQTRLDNSLMNGASKNKNDINIGGYVINSPHRNNSVIESGKENIQNFERESNVIADILTQGGDLSGKIKINNTLTKKINETTLRNENKIIITDSATDILEEPRLHVLNADTLVTEITPETTTPFTTNNIRRSTSGFSKHVTHNDRHWTIRKESFDRDNFNSYTNDFGYHDGTTPVTKLSTSSSVMTSTNDTEYNRTTTSVPIDVKKLAVVSETTTSSVPSSNTQEILSRKAQHLSKENKTKEENNDKAPVRITKWDKRITSRTHNNVSNQHGRKRKEPKRPHENKSNRKVKFNKAEIKTKQNQNRAQKVSKENDKKSGYWTGRRKYRKRKPRPYFINTGIKETVIPKDPVRLPDNKRQRKNNMSNGNLFNNDLLRRKQKFRKTLKEKDRQNRLTKETKNDKDSDFNKNTKTFSGHKLINLNNNTKLKEVISNVPIKTTGNTSIINRINANETFVNDSPTLQSDSKQPNMTNTTDISIANKTDREILDLKENLSKSNVVSKVFSKDLAAMATSNDLSGDRNSSNDDYIGISADLNVTTTPYYTSVRKIYRNDLEENTNTGDTNNRVTGIPIAFVSHVTEVKGLHFKLTTKPSTTESSINDSSNSFKDENTSSSLVAEIQENFQQTANLLHNMNTTEMPNIENKNEMPLISDMGLFNDTGTDSYITINHNISNQVNVLKVLQTDIDRTANNSALQTDMINEDLWVRLLKANEKREQTTDNSWRTDGPFTEKTTTIFDGNSNSPINGLDSTTSSYLVQNEPENMEQTIESLTTMEDVSKRYEDDLNNLDYNLTVNKSEVIENKNNKTLNSTKTKITTTDLVNKWNELMQQFRKQNLNNSNQLMSFLQKTSDSPKETENHFHNFLNVHDHAQEKDAVTKSLNPTIEWLGQNRKVGGEVSEKIKPSIQTEMNKLFPTTTEESIHKDKHDCKENQDYRLALNVLQTILQNMDKIKQPPTPKPHKRRYLLIPLGDNDPNLSRYNTYNDNSVRQNGQHYHGNQYQQEQPIPYRVRPRNPMLQMSLRSTF